MSIKRCIFELVCLVFLLQQVYAIPIEKVWVKGGSLSGPQGMLAIRSFDMSKYEVTNAQYAAFLNSRAVGADGIRTGKQLVNVHSNEMQLEFEMARWKAKNGYENHPIVMVSYYGAAEFCRWAGGRLPYESEWLYAASGGGKSKHFAFAGSNILDEVGWFKGNSEQHLHEVGKRKANELGLFDMSGNAWEWCLNDSLKNDQDFCVHMGGSWFAGEQPSRLDAHNGNTPTHFSNSVGFRIVFPIDTVLTNDKTFKKYKGYAWNMQPQEIPGKLQCEYYDLGGEGIAYHDNDSINNGSGKLNPANGTYLNEYRMMEGVDISYTKSGAIDNSPYNVVEPAMDQFYVGWTEPCEWINYSIKVIKSGLYKIRLMYTASGDGEIALLLDGKKLTNELHVPSTRNNLDTIPWRQWHHWNRIDSLATIPLKKGIHVLTLKTLTNGNMNYDFLEFILKK